MPKAIGIINNNDLTRTDGEIMPKIEVTGYFSKKVEISYNNEDDVWIVSRNSQWFYTGSSYSKRYKTKFSAIIGMFFMAIENM